MNRDLSLTLLQVIIFTIILVSQRYTEAKRHKSSRYWLDGLRHSRKHYHSRENTRHFLYPSLRKYNYYNDYEAIVQNPLHHHAHSRHRQHNYWNEEDTVNRLMRHTHSDKHMHGRSAKKVDTSNTERPTTPLTIRRADFTRVYATLKRIKTFSSSLGPASRHLKTDTTTEDIMGNLGVESSEMHSTSLKDKTTLENPTVLENSTTTEKSVAVENSATTQKSASTQNSVPLNVPTNTTENSDGTTTTVAETFPATETSATSESPTTKENNT